MTRMAPSILRWGSIPVGIGIGVWTALLTSFTSCGCPVGALSCNCGLVRLEATFAPWQCALFGAGAAVVLLVVSQAWREWRRQVVSRPPEGHSGTDPVRPQSLTPASANV